MADIVRQNVFKVSYLQSYSIFVSNFNMNIYLLSSTFYPIVLSDLS